MHSRGSTGMRQPFAGIVFLLAIGVLAEFASGGVLQVEQAAVVRAAPSRDAPIVGRVMAGAYLEAREGPFGASGYVPVRMLSPGEVAWIHGSLVRRMPWELPADTAQGGQSTMAGSASGGESRGDASPHLRLGKPEAVYERVRDGYALAEDARLKIPLWVQYELRPDDLGKGEERSDDFRADPSIPEGARSELADYRGSGYDRGHMAPAADMKRSPDAMTESFLLSNMAPQVGAGFNRGIWKNLEDAVRGWVERRGPLTIITGPVFLPEGAFVRYRIIGQNRVAVPTHFFKIVVDTQDPSRPDALAFLLPNENLSGRDFREFLTTIDEIEAATGLNFLSSLPTAVQRVVEATKAADVW